MPQTYVVAEQSGLIKVVQAGVVSPTPYLDLVSETYSAGLAGFFGFVFHPDYETNGWVYVCFAGPGASVIIRRYTRSTTDPLTADPLSALDMLAPVSPPGGVHGGGGLSFGPDGMLYIAIGDKRAPTGVECEAQLGSSLMGKILRLESDGSIPIDNPFVGDPGFRDEIFAYGLRQPFRMTFDQVTGDLYICDVGEDDWEEVNLISVTSSGGENFGWRVMEGNDCTGSAQCAGISCPPSGYVAPILSYPHLGNQNCVIGGTAYWGTGLPGLDGQFIYADWRGPLRSLRWDGAAVVETHDLTDMLAPGAGLTILSIHDVAAGHPGEVLFVSGGLGIPGKGEIYAIVPAGDAVVEVGPGLAGSVTPTLDVHAILEPASWFVGNAVMGATAASCFWVLGLTEVALPFKGGVLGPSPDIVLPLPMSTGVSHVKVLWPSGIPSGASFFLQVWAADAAGPKGFAATPSLRGTTP